MKQLHLSKGYIDKLKSLPATKPDSITSLNIFGYNFPVIENPLFPFEVHYDACDMETKQEVKIASGEWIHGAIIPQPEPYKMEPPPTLTFYEESSDVDDAIWNPSFRIFLERNWGMEIF